MTVTAVRPAEAGIKVGTFFIRSWGYDQTNVDFYKVVGLTPKGVRLQQWSSATVSDNGPQVHVVPGDGPRQERVWPKVTQDELAACGECRCHTEANYPGGYFYASSYCKTHGSREQDAPIQVKRLSEGGYPGVYVAVGDYASHARVWDGAPEYKTGSGWGH